MTSEDMVMLWDTLKPFFNKKENLAAADAFINFLDEAGFITELNQGEFEYDKHLKVAMESHFGVLEDEESDYGDEEYE